MDDCLVDAVAQAVAQGVADSARLAIMGASHGGCMDYALFPDEGHGFVRPANVAAFRILTKSFLARHLGDAFQAAVPGEVATTASIDGDAPPASSLTRPLTDRSDERPSPEHHD